MRDRETVEAIACELEQLIDENSLSGIMELIATICHEKADHLRANWGDRDSARVWTKAARQIEKIVSSTDL